MAANPQFIDLHTHSTMSDGSLNPGELVRKAKSIGLSALALSDHDTMSGVPEALEESKKLDIKLIPAIEVSCLYNSKEIHILGYKLSGYEENVTEIDKNLEKFSNKRRDRNLEIIRRLNEDDIDIRLNDFDKPADKLTRVDLAKKLIELNLVKDINQAFDRYLADNSKYVVPKLNNLDDVMEFFHKHSFFSSLAHPIQYRLSNVELDKLTATLKDKGLNAIEIYHSSHHISNSIKLKKLALKYNLKFTGGSDFHGSNKPDIHLGYGYGGMRVPFSILEDMYGI